MFEHGDSETKLFLTGMFRSGTTMLARMLASHGAIAFASDPFSRIFKSLQFPRRTCRSGNRSSITTRRLLLQSPGDPIAVPDEVGPMVRDRYQVRWRGDSEGRFDRLDAIFPDLAPLLSSIRGANFRELFLDGLRLVHEVYGSGATRVVGFKDVWTTEFVPGFLETFPNAGGLPDP